MTKILDFILRENLYFFWQWNPLFDGKKVFWIRIPCVVSLELVVRLRKFHLTSTYFCGFQKLSDIFRFSFHKKGQFLMVCLWIATSWNDFRQQKLTYSVRKHSIRQYYQGILVIIFSKKLLQKCLKIKTSNPNQFNMLFISEFFIKNYQKCQSRLVSWGIPEYLQTGAAVAERP